MSTAQSTLPPLNVPMPGEGNGDFVVPDPDVYELVIAGVMETRQATYKGQVKEGKYQVRLKFEVADPDSEFAGVSWPQWVGYSMHEKAFLRQVILAIRNGRPLENGKPVDLLKYVNRPFRGVVKVDEVPSRDDPTRIMRFAKLTDAMPLKGAAKPDPEPEPGPIAAPPSDAGGDDPFDD